MLRGHLRVGKEPAVRSVSTVGYIAIHLGRKALFGLPEFSLEECSMLTSSTMRLGPNNQPQLAQLR
jgi:hypothetical protein